MKQSIRAGLSAAAALVLRAGDEKRLSAMVRASSAPAGLA